MRIVYFIILFLFVCNYAKNQGLTNSLTNEIATRVKVSGHNIGKITKPSQTGLTGLDFTVNSDGSVKVNGTSTAAWSFIMNNAMLLKAGSYTLSSGIGANPNLYVQITNENQSASIASTANSAEKTFTLNVDTIVVYRLFYQSGQTFNNVVVKPMIRLATDESADYEPYSMTNREMTPYVQAISNPNLLDNPWFTVNQRGQSSYSNLQWEETVDRYRARTIDAFSVTDDGLKADTSNGFALLQRIEKTRLAGKSNEIFTLSILLSTGEIFTASGTAVNGFSFSNERVRIELYNPNFEWIGINIFVYNNTDVIRAVKLELGSVSTLAQDTAPNYAAELLKCQRYFVRLSPVKSYTAFGAGIYSSNHVFAEVTLPTALRAEPNVSFSAIRLQSNGRNTVHASSITVNNYINNIVSLKCAPESGANFVNGDYCEIQLNVNEYLDLSCVL